MVHPSVQLLPSCSHDEGTCTSCDLTWLAQGCDRVWAWFFWMSTLSMWWGKQASYVWICAWVGAWIGEQEEAHNEAQQNRWNTTSNEMWQKLYPNHRCVDRKKGWSDMKRSDEGGLWSHWAKYGFLCIFFWGCKMWDKHIWIDVNLLNHSPTRVSLESV